MLTETWGDMEYLKGRTILILMIVVKSTSNWFHVVLFVHNFQNSFSFCCRIIISALHNFLWFTNFKWPKNHFILFYFRWAWNTSRGTTPFKLVTCSRATELVIPWLDCKWNWPTCTRSTCGCTTCPPPCSPSPPGSPSSSPPPPTPREPPS